MQHSHDGSAQGREPTTGKRMTILEFIEQSNRAQCLDELSAAFSQTLELFGYNRALCIGIEGHRPDVVRTTNGRPRYTQEYLDWYKSNNSHHVDPIFKLSPRHNVPYTFDDVRRMPLGKRQMEVMNMRRELIPGVVLMLPIRNNDTQLLSMGIAGDTQDARMDRDAIAQLFAICNQFHLRRSDLQQQNVLCLKDVNLSSREREMLQWCLYGKSNGVIADIIGISHKTVEFHLQSAYKKLDCSNRTMAVLKAVNLQLISV
jgi:DNA-binding CsgD family transcriptional regulator